MTATEKRLHPLRNQPIEKIGIAMACYKPETKSFRRQLESIQQQSFRNWVCVCNFDSSLSEIRESPELQAIRKDTRFIFRENPQRLGVLKNFESALRVVVGETVDAVAFADQDDYWYPEKLDELRKSLDLCPPNSLVHADMRVLKEQQGHSETLAESAWAYEHRYVWNQKLYHFLLRNTVTGAALLMDVSLAKSFPVVPEELPMHDHWFALCAASMGGVYPIQRVLHDYIQHEANVVGVVPYVGLVGRPPGVSYREVLSRGATSWSRTVQLARAAQSAGLDLKGMASLTKEISPMAAVQLFALGVMHLGYDRPFARASFFKSAGCVFRLCSWRAK